MEPNSISKRKKTSLESSKYLVDHLSQNASVKAEVKKKHIQETKIKESNTETEVKEQSKIPKHKKPK
jgi:hypothetical protein